MAASDVDPLVGQVLSGRFEIVSSLGVGGMGRVYRAVQRPLGREVALKVLNPRYDGSKDPGFERRFFLEASMTSKLKHPNTITVHDYGRTDDGIYYIAMELLEGETLQQVLVENGSIPWPRALFIGGQIARSLREAHRLGLVHRDLKPANVMLMSEGTGGDTVKVLDFGLVKSFTPDLEGADEDAISEVGLTQAGVLLGSPLYMAPEQARGEADPRTDIYAMGVLLFQAMAGRPPFISKESIEVIVKHIREPPPQLNSLVALLPDDVNALVMKCLAKDPAARFQSMDEVLDAMRSATSGEGLSAAFADPRSITGQGSGRVLQSQIIQVRDSRYDAPAVTRPEPQRGELADAAAPPTPSRKWVLWGAAAVVTIGGIGVGAFAGYRALTPPPTLEAKVPSPVPQVPSPTTAQPDVMPRAAEPVQVRLEIDSEPQGATVTREGSPVGTTPLRLTVTRSNEEPVHVELGLSLEGYQNTTVVAHGLEGLIQISKTLTLDPSGRPHVRPVKKPKTPQGTTPDGYKDDPY
jgi:serine/threonine protein kinase